MGSPSIYTPPSAYVHALTDHISACLQLSIAMKPRSWHVSQPLYNCTSTECRVAIFGGNVHVEGMWGDRKNAADLTILSFGQCVYIVKVLLSGR